MGSICDCFKGRDKENLVRVKSLDNNNKNLNTSVDEKVKEGKILKMFLKYFKFPIPPPPAKKSPTLIILAASVLKLAVFSFDNDSFSFDSDNFSFDAGSSYFDAGSSRFDAGIFRFNTDSFRFDTGRFLFDADSF